MGALDMQPDDAIIPFGGDGSFDGLIQNSPVIRNDGRHDGYCSEYAMGRRNVRHTAPRRRSVEHHTTTAVDLQINKTRCQTTFDPHR